MECQICSEVFDSIDRRPRNLDCGHTFCESCIRVLATINSRVSCPNCRTICRVKDPSKLPINYVAVEFAQRHEEDRRRASYCVQHLTEQLRFFCNNCEAEMCVECIIAHSGHSFVRLEHSATVMLRRADAVQELLALAHDRAAQTFKSASALRDQILSSSRQMKAMIGGTFDYLAELLERQRKVVEESYGAAVEQEAECLSEQLEALESEQKELAREEQSLRSLRAELHTLSDLQMASSRDFTGILSQKKAAAQRLVNTFNCRLSATCPTFTLEDQSLKKAIMDFGQKQFMRNPGIAFFGDKNKVMVFDLTTKTWEFRHCGASNEFNYYSAAVTLPDGSALITGGGSSNSVFRFASFKLEQFPPMRQVRKEHSAVCLGLFVYVMGGYDGIGNRFLRSCERFSLESQTWTDVQNLNVARCAFSATPVYDEFIYIFGGYDGSQRLASIERYLPDEDLWQSLTVTLRFPLSNCACLTTRENHVVVLGGGFSSGFSMAVEMLNLESEQWTSLPMMTEGRDLRNKVAVYDGRVYCVGGYNFKAEALDLSSREWIQLPNYPVNDNLDSWSCALLHTVK